MPGLNRERRPANRFEKPRWMSNSGALTSRNACSALSKLTGLASVPLATPGSSRISSRVILPWLIFDLAQQNGAKLVQVIRHEYFIIAGFEQDGRRLFLHPFSCTYRVNGPPLLDAAQLLAERRPAVGSNGDPKRFIGPGWSLSITC